MLCIMCIAIDDVIYSDAVGGREEGEDVLEEVLLVGVQVVPVLYMYVYMYMYICIYKIHNTNKFHNHNIVY